MELIHQPNIECLKNKLRTLDILQGLDGNVLMEIVITDFIKFYGSRAFRKLEL